MRFFRKDSDNAKPLAVAPGMYGNESPEQLIFDRTTRISVERNHWKVATLGLGCIALAAIMTREPPPSVVKAVGVSADASGKPIVRELEAFQPEGIQLQWALKDLVTRWFTIEPILTTQVEDSRMARNLRSVREQMIGSSRKQFEDWVAEDEPFRQVGASATLVREVKVTNVAVLPDSTVAVEFITTTTEDGYKPRKMRYAMTFRYQVKPPTSDAVLGTNPFGVHPVFFSLQKSPA
ncbi:MULTISPECIES: VirB8/TrbF family protein [Cupriavidus]|uniref:Type IV secretion system protein n=1 Tax=Cupriavidus basilensis TaxID=68895 RepID=A0A643FUT9_9BURK|nr:MULTISPECIES: VirB8/TrbF family protein [Cupriavidus]KUE86432.1 type VI secretion protein [Cupriavidus necator]NOV23636.1 type IV secretion system protein [Cupriavidus necator]QOT81705.1 type IV secretion system protein [Cupriavidus basilensis]BDB30077.1 type IV secretion system protein [Cupriavidus sp. P-10]